MIPHINKKTDRAHKSSEAIASSFLHVRKQQFHKTKPDNTRPEDLIPCAGWADILPACDSLGLSGEGRPSKHWTSLEPWNPRVWDKRRVQWELTWRSLQWRYMSNTCTGFFESFFFLFLICEDISATLCSDKNWSRLFYNHQLSCICCYYKEPSDCWRNPPVD